MPLDPFGLNLRRLREIMEATAGGRSGRGYAASRKPLFCSFCGEEQTQVTYLIAGPGHCICSCCVHRARTALATPGRTASAPEPTATTWRASAADEDENCSFCGKSNQGVVAMAVADGGQICNECLDLCDEIIEYNQA
jgi:hypothetical protein